MAVVDYEVRDRIAYVTLNRPEKLNALTREMLDLLWDAFTAFNDDPEAWLCIVTGTGRAFSVGHDLVEMGQAGAKPPKHTTDELYYMEQHIWKPIIAAVNGLCLAQGAGIALGADIRVASEAAQFGWPQVKRGITSISGPGILSHRLPLCTALELLFTGEFMPASEALRHGLVNYVVPQDEVMGKAQELADKILENAPLAVRAMKEAAIRGLDLPLSERLSVGAEMFERIKATKDAQEGLAAFQEKRTPVWRGR